MSLVNSRSKETPRKMVCDKCGHDQFMRTFKVGGQIVETVSVHRRYANMGFEVELHDTNDDAQTYCGGLTLTCDKCGKKHKKPKR